MTAVETKARRKLAEMMLRSAAAEGRINDFELLPEGTIDPHELGLEKLPREGTMFGRPLTSEEHEHLLGVATAFAVMVLGLHHVIFEAAVGVPRIRDATPEVKKRILEDKFLRIGISAVVVKLYELMTKREK